MASHKTYEESIRDVYKGLALLAVVTLIEVFISLLGKGHIGVDLSGSGIVLGIIALALIGLSIYKAYFIIYEFMHMRYEVKGLALSVLLPTLLLVWAIIAFFQEGNSWKERREDIKKREMSEPVSPQGVLEADVFVPELG
ncbi:MAG: cytochrome C oxidase subunit IV family protein [Saprospiraceae bacterium]